jgi:hypothetical protein
MVVDKAMRAAAEVKHFVHLPDEYRGYFSKATRYKHMLRRIEEHMGSKYLHGMLKSVGMDEIPAATAADREAFLSIVQEDLRIKRSETRALHS